MSSMVMDHPRIGRKKSVYYGFSVVFVVTCLILIFGEDNKPALFIIFVIIKFVISSTFMVFSMLFRLCTLILQKYTRQ